MFLGLDLAPPLTDIIVHVHRLVQGRIQDFVKEGGGGGGCTLHGQNVIRETQQYDNNPKITIIILTIFYIIILTPLAKKKVSGRQSVAIGLHFLHPFGGLKWGAHPLHPPPRIRYCSARSTTMCGDNHALPLVRSVQFGLLGSTESS